MKLLMEAHPVGSAPTVTCPRCGSPTAFQATAALVSATTLITQGYVTKTMCAACGLSHGVWTDPQDRRCDQHPHPDR